MSKTVFRNTEYGDRYCILTVENRRWQRSKKNEENSTDKKCEKNIFLKIIFKVDISNFDQKIHIRCLCLQFLAALRPACFE